MSELQGDEPTFWRPCARCDHLGWTVMQGSSYVCPRCVLGSHPDPRNDQEGRAQ